MPFHLAVLDLLAIMNIAPIQLSANGWRILLGFIAKCQRDGVRATARLFFFFFYPRWVDNLFISYYRRPGRPLILEHAVSNPKAWQYKFFYIEGSGSRRPFWVRSSDERAMFPLSWRRPRLGPFECNWRDLTVDERLGALRLITTDPLDPKHCMLLLLLLQVFFTFVFF